MAENLLDVQSQVVRVEKLAGLGRLAAGVAHEVRNPLGALGSYVEVLERRGTDPKVTADMHQAIRQTLAFNLKAIVAQKLLPSIKPGVHRVPTNEIMVVNPTIKKLIEEGEDLKLADAIKLFYQEGMVDFTENLKRLVDAGDIDKATALEWAPDPEKLKMAFKGIKVSAAGIL